MEGFNTQRYQMLERFRWMFRVRMLAAGFVFIVYFFVRKINIFGFPFIPFASCCFLEAFVNQPYAFLTKRVKALGALTYTHLIIDIVLISLIIHYLGGIEFAFFSVAYPLIIIIAGIMLSRKACYFVAFVSSIAYSAIVALEFYNLIPHNPLFGFRLDGLHQFGIVAANILFFYFVAFISGYSTDLIQERTRKFEREKKFSENVIATLLDGLVILDVSGRIKEINKAVERMTGLTREEIIGLDITPVLFASASREAFLRAFDEAKTKGEIKGLELELVSGIPVSINASLLKMQEEGENVVAIMRDISKEKAIDKLKTEFISTVTHELLTPLTSISGFVTMMLNGKAGAVTEEQKNFLGIVKRQAAHLKGLIQSMLDFSRIETGRLELHPEPAQVEDVISEVINDMQPQLQEKHINIQVGIKDGLPQVLVDKARLSRAFSNILGNAIKFTPRGRAINISVEDERGYIRIKVMDEGIGISKENLEKVFEKFYQVDSALTRVVGGAGMGLSIAREIIEKHNGQIWVESPGIGGGSTFIFTLPVS